MTTARKSGPQGVLTLWYNQRTNRHPVPVGISVKRRPKEDLVEDKSSPFRYLPQKKSRPFGHDPQGQSARAQRKHIRYLHHNGGNGKKVQRGRISVFH